MRLLPVPASRIVGWESGPDERADDPFHPRRPACLPSHRFRRPKTAGQRDLVCLRLPVRLCPCLEVPRGPSCAGPSRRSCEPSRGKALAPSAGHLFRPRLPVAAAPPGHHLECGARLGFVPVSGCARRREREREPHESVPLDPDSGDDRPPPRLLSRLLHAVSKPEKRPEGGRTLASRLSRGARSSVHPRCDGVEQPSTARLSLGVHGVSSPAAARRRLGGRPRSQRPAGRRTALARDAGRDDDPGDRPSTATCLYRLGRAGRSG